MNRISFRPLWSLDVIKTEDYLSKMAEKGYCLNGINFPLKVFKFNKGDCQKINYRITYSKDYGNKLAVGLINDGWKTCAENKRWRVLKNEKEISKINNFPARDGVIKRNKTIWEVILGLLLFSMTTSLPNMFILGGLRDKNSTVSYDNGIISISDHNSLTQIFYYDLISYAVYLIFIILALISILKLSSCNKKLKYENGDYGVSKVYGNGKKFNKVKFGWFCHPDVIENWLENMELQEFNLYKVGLYFFSFIKGKKKRIKYYMDFHRLSSEDYYNIHSSSGWELVKSSYPNNNKWSFWKKEYDENQPKPSIYSDNISKIDAAKIVLVNYLPAYLFIAIIYTLVLGNFIKIALRIKHPNLLINMLSITASLVFSFSVVLFSLYSIRLIKYYFRIKNKID